MQRLLRSTQSEEEPPVDASVGETIEAERGGGRSLDESTQEGLGASLQADLRDVRVHDDAEADGLSRAVQADAFTTGSDVFFRAGKYQPGTGEGDRLLAHELTHVVQQRQAPPEGGELTVSDPSDASEQQASGVADQIAMSSPAAAPSGVARQELPDEEEEMLQPSPSLDRQEPLDEEEEMLQPSPSLDRQEPLEEEEEMLQPSPSLDRQEMPEEEEMLQASLHRDLSDDLEAAAGS